MHTCTNITLDTHHSYSRTEIDIYITHYIHIFYPVFIHNAVYFKEFRLNIKNGKLWKHKVGPKVLI